MPNIHLSRKDIETLIPHREPMLLLDEAEIEGPAKITGDCRIRGDEFFLRGHYPGNPIVPGNLLCEMLAQLGAVLIHYNMTQPALPFGELRKNRTPLLAGLDSVRFKTPVRPGDYLHLQIILTKDAGLIVNAEGTVSVYTEKGGQSKAALTAELLLAFI